jgi:hypothetical protein
MRGANPRCRWLLTIGVLAQVAVVMALSNATRRPYRGSNSVSWHTSKAARMNTAPRKVSDKAHVLRRDSDSERQPRSNRKVAFFAFELNPQKPFLALALDKFRSPPSLS